MSEHRTTQYSAESEGNARIIVRPINDRLHEAGWRAVSSVWSDDMPGFWEEELEGHILAHSSAGGSLTVTYERDHELPVLPLLRAEIKAAANTEPDVKKAVHRLARLAQQTHLPIGQENSFKDSLTTRQTFMGGYLARRLERNPELAEAYRALPARLRLEVERADADAFLEAYAE